MLAMFNSALFPGRRTTDTFPGKIKKKKKKKLKKKINRKLTKKKKCCFGTAIYSRVLGAVAYTLLKFNQ
jgi:hypothetical protein